MRTGTVPVTSYLKFNPLRMASYPATQSASARMVIANNNDQPPYGRETHAGEVDIAPGRLLLNESPIPEGPNDSPDANRREERGFCGVANEDGDFSRVSSAVLGKMLEDAALDVT